MLGEVRIDHHHFLRRRLPPALSVAVLLALTPFVAHASPAAAQIVTPPASIAADCSTDVTAQLNSWFASLASGTTVSLAQGACYEVATTLNPDSANVYVPLTLDSTSGLTINGNGATFEQPVYNPDDGGCSQDVFDPVVWLTGNTNLTINDVTLDGPGTCSAGGGAGTEGDYGILVGKTATGNSGLTMNGVTIEKK